MSERTAFAVVNKSGKVVEYTSRIPYQYGQVFYKGNIYQLKNPQPGVKSKYIIVLGTGYPVTNKKAITKSPRKTSLTVTRKTIIPTPKTKTFSEIIGEEGTSLFKTIVDINADESLETKEDVDYNIDMLQESIDEGYMEPYEEKQYYKLIDYLKDFRLEL